MRNLDAFDLWLNEIEKKKNWPPAKNWSNREFQILSEEIHQKTYVQINRNTLRHFVERVIARDDSYIPQSATKDALAIYIGYSNWKVFTERTSKIKKSNWTNPIIYIAAATIGIVAGWLIFRTIGNNENFSFHVVNPVGKAPHTVTFKHDFSNLKKQSVNLDLGHMTFYEEYFLKPIIKKDSLSKLCFHFPGVFMVRLFVDDKVVRKKVVRVLSDGWFVYVANTKDPRLDIPPMVKKGGFPFRYLPNIRFDNIFKDYESNGYFHINPQDIAKKEGISVNYLTHLLNIKDFGIGMNNLEFAMRFKNEQYGTGVHCHEVTIQLFGTKGHLSFVFVEKGCGKYANFQIGKRYVSGSRTENLDFMEFDFSQLHDLRIKRDPQGTNLFLDDQLLKKIPGRQKLGQLVGLHLSFKGAPHIDSIELKDSSDKVIFEDQFNN